MMESIEYWNIEYHVEDNIAERIVRRISQSIVAMNVTYADIQPTSSCIAYT